MNSHIVSKLNSINSFLVISKLNKTRAFKVPIIVFKSFCSNRLARRVSKQIHHILISPIIRQISHKDRSRWLVLISSLLLILLLWLSSLRPIPTHIVLVPLLVLVLVTAAEAATTATTTSIVVSLITSLLIERRLIIVSPTLRLFRLIRLVLRHLRLLIAIKATSTASYSTVTASTVIVSTSSVAVSTAVTTTALAIIVVGVVVIAPALAA